MSKDQKNQRAPQSELVSVILPKREEGWFCFTEYQIPLSVLEKEGKVLTKSTPDLFAIFKDQMIWKVRDLFNL